jgi:hypothetical protein
MTSRGGHLGRLLPRSRNANRLPLAVGSDHEAAGLLSRGEPAQHEPAAIP